VLVRQAGPLAGLTHRVGQFFEGMDELNEIERELDRRGVEVEDAPTVRAEAISCFTPEGKQLFHNLSFEVKPGRGMVIMGPSGCGKSSLLRVVAGLWPIENGRLFRPIVPSSGGTFFVPQRPYITEGTLRDQVLYPHSAEEQTVGDAEIVQLIETMRLGHLLTRPEGLDAVEEWDSMLSVGEQQRLGFARMLYHKPKYALMDEATSALDVDMQELVMTLALRQGITPISVAHRPSVIPFHKDMLLFDGNGGATFATVEELDASALQGGDAAVEESASAVYSDGAAPRRRAVARLSVTSAPSAVSGGGGAARNSFGVKTERKTGEDGEEDQDVVREVAGGFGLTGDQGEGKNMKFNRVLIKRLAVMIKLGFPHIISKPVGVAVWLVGVMVASSWVQIQLAYLAGPIYEVRRFGCTGLLFVRACVSVSECEVARLFVAQGDEQCVCVALCDAPRPCCLETPGWRTRSC